MLNINEIEKAHQRIKPYIKRTELRKSTLFQSVNLHLKLECHQLTNSFKIRGALSKITSLNPEILLKGVMTVSSGNHGAAVSYASNLLNISKANIIVPSCTPQSKIENIKKYGADVLIMGSNYDEAHQLGEDYKEKHDLTYIDAYYDDLFIYAGQGTIGLEIMDQMPDVDIILVPVGGGGLITGIATAAKAISKDVQVIGLQTSACPAMIRAIEENVFYDTFPIEPNICDALVGGIGKRAYEMRNETIDEMIEVDESAVFEAAETLYQKDGIIAEPSSCLFVAAINSNLERFKDMNVVAVVSGGNIDTDILRKFKEDK